MSDAHFDLVVIGTGPAGSSVAQKARSAGKQVAIIEEREFGGTCALRGCNPKKVYTNAGNLADRAAGAKTKLIDYQALRIDWASLLHFKREFTQPVLDTKEADYRKQGIKTFHGTARFVGPKQLQVGNQTLSAERIFIGAGSRPRPLNFPGGEQVILSDEFLELPHVPSRILFIGAGYVSMEFACVAARSGARVTVLERGQHALQQFDADLVSQLVDYSTQHGMDLQTQATVQEITTDPAITVHYEKSGQSAAVETDLVVHGAGRIPNLSALNLEAGEIAADKHGISVDPFMRSTTNPIVFVGGDCANSGQPQLTPTANEEARAAMENIFAEEPSCRPDYGVVPRVAFTAPPLAAIGISQSEAEATGNIDIRYANTSTWNSVRKSGQLCAGYKLMIDRHSDRIVGAHLLGPSADETINLYALAMKYGLTATELKATLFAFPTFASDVRNMV